MKPTVYFSTLLALMSLIALSPRGIVVAEPAKQIQISAKFVEISEKNTEELGFDPLMEDLYKLFRSGPHGVDSSFKFPVTDLTEAGPGSTTNPPSGGVGGILSNLQFQQFIRDLNQKKGVDLLSAPTVITRSGQRAKIEIIRNVIYPIEFDPTGHSESFFHSGETVIGIGGGAAFGDLFQTHTTTRTERQVQVTEQTENRQVQVGTQQQFINNQWVDVPVFENRSFTTEERQVITEQIREQELEGIMDENSPKFAVDFTHFISKNVGIGGQFEWIHGNLSNAFMGQAKATYRLPIELERVGIAPYFTGGLGLISGDAINEVVGSVGAGLEVRPQNNVGFYTEYSHNFIGNGMNFGQILAGIRIVLNPNDKGSGGSFPPSSSGSGLRNSGINLDVTPVVGDDGNTIDLTLAPEVVEFEGFINYGSPITTPSAPGSSTSGEVPLTENRIEMPVFNVRKVTTQAKIWDGETVVLGGLIREDVQNVDDKVPILGDIPLIGRLFRSQSEKHFKRNLVIFVRARLIDPE